MQSYQILITSREYLFRLYQTLCSSLSLKEKLTR